MSLLSVDEARARILSHFKPVESESISMVDAANRVLFQDIVAETDLPLFDNSSMDGFALRADDVSGASDASPRRLRVVTDIPAGVSPAIVLAPGEAARIMTGAQLPEGADAVVPVEDTDVTSRDAGSPMPEHVGIRKSVNLGANVRPRGMDLHKGDIVLHKGHRLDARSIGLLAMFGISKVQVHGKPRVGLISSGDELLSPDAPLEPGKIRDSNTYMLTALIQSAEADVLHLGVARDTFESVETILDRATEQNVDVILSSAGVSVGAFDFVKSVIEANGKLDFWRVNMRPGKPLAVGEYKGVQFIGLPGNPVSAYVGFEVFVRAVIGKLSGLPDRNRPTVRVRCDAEINSDGRESYLRATIHEQDGLLHARLSGHQGSGNLLSLVHADALLIIPAGVKCVPAGQEVYAWLL